MTGVYTLGEFRAATADLPDDTIIAGEFEEPLAFNEIGQVKILPAGSYVVGADDGDQKPYVEEMTPAVLLFGGQIINHEYAFDVRYDQEFLGGIGG